VRGGVCEKSCLLWFVGVFFGWRVVGGVC